MFKLYRMQDDVLAVVKDSHMFSGSDKEIIEYMMEIGVEAEEIECALISLLQKGKSLAHFGINKTFIFAE